MKTIVQKVNFKISPEGLYALFMDSKKHSEATGGKATISRKVGGTFTAWEGYIRGKNLFLAPGRMIVQTWRGGDFKKKDADSILVLAFEKAPGGTILTMTHAGLPAKQAAGMAKGWYQFYWTPIQKYLKKRA